VTVAVDPLLPILTNRSFLLARRLVGCRMSVDTRASWSITSLATLIAGICIGWMDTRPHWDDTGITAGALLMVSAGAALLGVRPWLAAGLTVGPLLLLELSGGGWGLILAPVFALAGAYGGSIARRLASRPPVSGTKGTNG
jgi:hypothetical protein